MTNKIGRQEVTARLEFESYLTHRNQRDTEKHAEILIKRKVLDEYQQSHATVAAAMLPDGTMYKVDGHTRSLLWNEDEPRVPVPDVLSVMVYDVDDLEEMKALYESIDSSSSVKGGPDSVYGTFRENEFHPQSSIIKKSNLVTAIKVADVTGHGASSMDTVGMRVNRWLEEIKVVDDVLVNARGGKSEARYNSSAIAAMLLSLRRRGTVVLPFWIKYFGAKEDVLLVTDPVFKAWQMMEHSRIAGKTAGPTNAVTLTGKLLSCLERDLAGDAIAGQVKPTNVSKYLKKSQMAKTSRRANAPPRQRNREVANVEEAEHVAAA